MLALYRSGRQADALDGVPRRAGGARRARDRAGRGAAGSSRRQILTQDAALDLPRERLLVGRARRARPASRAARAGAAVPVRRPRGRAGGAARAARARRGRRGRASSCSRARRAPARRGSCASSRTRRRRAACSSCYGASDAAVSTPYQPLREWLEFLLRVCDPEALAECLGERRDAVRGSCPSSSG